MGQEDIRKLTRKIYINGALTPLITFHVIITAIILFFFSFDAGMMLIYLYAVLIATAAVIPPEIAVIIV
jgi:hypothetical protein